MFVYARFLVAGMVALWCMCVVCYVYVVYSILLFVVCSIRSYKSVVYFI